MVHLIFLNNNFGINNKNIIEFSLYKYKIKST